MQFIVMPVVNQSQSAPGVTPGAGFMLHVGHSGMSMAVKSGYLATGASKYDNRRTFRLEALGGEDVGYFRLRHIQSGKVADVSRKSTSPGARICLYQYKGEHHQQFALQPSGDGVMLVARHSKLAMTVKGGASGTGVDIVQAAKTGAPEQQWKVDFFLSVYGPFAIASAYSGHVLTDIDGKLQQREWGAEKRQQWSVWGADGRDIGYYYIRNEGTNRLFTIPNASTSEGALVELRGLEAGATNQHFAIVDEGQGRFTFVARHSRLALGLHVTSDNAQMIAVELKYQGTRVSQQAVKSSWRQQWHFGRTRQHSDLTSLKVRLYEHANYSGAYQELGPGYWNLGALTLTNDTISSIKIPPGLRVTLFEHADFGGAKSIHERDVAKLGEFNDKTSSLLVTMVANLYTDTNFGGEATPLGLGQYKAKHLKSDTASSIRVPPGLVVTLFEHDDFEGQSWTFIEDATNLACYADRVSSAVVEQLGALVPMHPVRFGSKIQLRSSHGKYLVAEKSGDLNANRSEASSYETFEVVRSGKTRYQSLLSYGDVISLKTHHGTYVGRSGSGSGRADATSISDAERFLVERTGDGRSNHFPSQDDVLSLRVMSARQYVAAEKSGDVNINRTKVGSYERWRLAHVEPPPSLPKAEENTFCGVAACLTDACGVATCGANETVESVCGVATAGIAVCVADACGAASCTVAASGVGLCGADACTAAACGVAATAFGVTLVGACGAALGGITGCGADVCGANACGLNFCPADACGADVCGIDLIPVIPFI